VAEILSIEGNKIRVTGLDALNGTPILDIKSYEEHFESLLQALGAKGTSSAKRRLERLAEREKRWARTTLQQSCRRLV
jgi:tRNA (Thr-GGU) A37 N-methylase